jgi:HAMP domain-containing protein
VGFTRVRDWRVRTRLGAVLLLPALAFALVSGAHATGAVSDALDWEDTAARITVAVAAADLMHEAQRERDAGGSGELADVRTRALAATDAAVLRLRAVARDAGAASDPVPQWELAYATVRATGSADDYAALVTRLVELIDGMAAGVDDAGVAQLAGLALEVALVKDATARLRGFGQSYLAGGDSPIAGGRLDQLRDARIWAAARLEQARLRLPAAQRPFETPRGGTSATLEELANELTTGTMDDMRWWTATSAEVDRWREAERAVYDRLAAGVSSRIDAARTRVALVLLLVLGVLALAVTLSVVIGRSTANALRALRERALAIADHELPATIARLRTAGPHDELPEQASPARQPADEIGEVSAAFEAVHRSAVELAVEQARSRHALNAIFRNLARRSQVLVERQLLLLDEMERDERDPDRLSALFRLDHLAARMRRNDENLLVLAGAEGRRRWHEPVPLAALALAALAEIEQYERVRADIDHRLHVLGWVAGDLVHLFAELLDNATSFSAPDSPVQVTARADADGAQLEIVDGGIGAGAETLTELNRLLAAPPRVDVATSERMGLVVVSHLAHRHGVTVKLASPGARGMRALIWLPAALLAQSVTPLVTVPPVERTAPASTGLPSSEPPAIVTGAPRSAATAVRQPPAGPQRAVPQRADLSTTDEQPTTAPVLAPSGLPKRIPRPAQPQQARRAGLLQRTEPDPEAVASTLTKLHEGVRRGQAGEVDGDRTTDHEGQP